MRPPHFFLISGQSTALQRYPSCPVSDFPEIKVTSLSRLMGDIAVLHGVSMRTRSRHGHCHPLGTQGVQLCQNLAAIPRSADNPRQRDRRKFRSGRPLSTAIDQEDNKKGHTCPRKASGSGVMRQAKLAAAWICARLNESLQRPAPSSLHLLKFVYSRCHLLVRDERLFFLFT